MAKTQEELNDIKKELRSFAAKVQELSDEELKEITGGEYYDLECHEKQSDVTYLFDIGNEVEVNSGWGFGTVRCKVVGRRIAWYETNTTGTPGIYVANVRGYRDEYQVYELENHWYFYLNNEWLPRSDIQVRALPK